MSIDPARINITATEALPAFQSRVAGIPYERKGILYSEMFFLYLCAQAAKPTRIFESGRARGQSTLLLSAIFPDLDVVSIESDADSPDVQVAQERLRGRDKVSMRFGDATRILPAEVRKGDVVLIDGPKGFRGLRLALRLLAPGRVTQVFIHDCGLGTEERAFLDAHLRGALYSDSIEFAPVARIGDTLLTTPAMRAITSAYPGCHITALAHPKRAEVLQGLPFLAHIGGITKNTAPWRGRFGGRSYDYALVYGFDEALVAYALRVAGSVVAFRQRSEALNRRLYRCVDEPPAGTENAVARCLRLTTAL